MLIPSPSFPWVKVIAQGLRLLINLKEFARCSSLLDHALTSTQTQPQQWGHSIYHSLYAWILDKTPFQLKMFCNNMFDLEPTVPFLMLQPCITTWHHLDTSPCFYDHNLIPLLSDVAIPSKLLLEKHHLTPYCNEV